MIHPTHEEYQISSNVTLLGTPFHALLCALFRRAKPNNLAILKEMFPVTYQNFKRRYNAPGGLLPGETGTIDGLTYLRSSVEPFEVDLLVEEEQTHDTN